ncbi:AAA family ATPase [Thiofilum flexile]|uniref:AAA family ATPase n=1 Tax=Thiofilum flexile TaxID=125627 RepID=UPI0003701A9C|nr:ATP-binding protein [Thiofilum flexile]
MFSKIWSNALKGYASEPQESEYDYLEVKKVNFFVGANNSGKSRLIRELVKSKRENYTISSDAIFEAIDKILSYFKEKSEDSFKKRAQYLRDAPLESLLEIELLIKDFNQFASEYSYKNGRQGIGKITELNDSKYPTLSSIKEISLKEITINLSPNVDKKHYIPILRGLRPFDSNKDHYLDRTTKDYFDNLYNNSIDTGFNLYENLMTLLLGQPEQRKIVREYEKILGDHFFDQAELTLIPEYKKDTVAVKIGIEKQFPIYHLGDGLQQIIIITSAAYLETEPSMFFIEEPEINLHPGMLRKLIHFLIDHTPHQYFITTHSNHLIDFYNYSDQVTVHRLKKKVEGDKTTFTIHDCKEDKDLLRELGVLNTSVYLANSTIWVEGITDRLYLKAYMKKYLTEHPEKQQWQNYSEHIHYAFVEYQGGVLGHWDFNEDEEASDSLKALKLCATPFLIADGDIKTKGDRYQILVNQLGDSLFVTQGKEFENMLPEEILKATANDFFNRASKKKEGLSSENLINIKYNDYFSSPNGIGKYLDGLVESTNNLFSAASGTIREKVKFCDIACEHMYNKNFQWELTPELTDLCEKIFTHIERCNS